MPHNIIDNCIKMKYVTSPDFALYLLALIVHFSREYNFFLPSVSVVVIGSLLKKVFRGPDKRKY